MPRHRRHHRPAETGYTENNPQASLLDISNLANIASLINSVDLSKVASMLGTVNNTSINGNTPNNNNSSGREQPVNSEEAARKNELANALRVLINADKNELLQVALQFYVASRNNANNINDGQ